MGPRASASEHRHDTATAWSTTPMIPTDSLATALTIVPAAIFVGILVSVAAIVRSIVTTAEPSGPRTMDPTASWRAEF